MNAAQILPQQNGLQVFTPVAAEISLFAAGLMKVQVTSPETAEEASKMLNEATRLKKKIEELRDQAVRPLNERVKLINAHAKTISADLLAALDCTKQQLISWEDKLRKEREELKRQADAARAAREEELRLQALKDVTPPAPAEDDWSDLLNPQDHPLKAIAEANIQAEIARQKAELDHEHRLATKAIEANRVKGTSVRKKLMLEDASKVEDRFWVIDMKLVNEFWRETGATPAGFKVVEETTLAVRG
jgi:hypothetical protein